MAKQFFEEQSEQSQVKANITAKYFWAWAKVITGYQKRQGEPPKIGYIDLFAGPGRYRNGAKSTPVLILEQALDNPQFRESLVTIFNDKDEDKVNDLEKAINELPGIEELTYEPAVHCNEVGTEIVKQFEDMNLIPTLMFVDPWGYKGLSLRLVNSVLKDWACECIFFFNYNRINMGLNNDAVKVHMEALFGEDKVDEIRELLEAKTPEQREVTIIEELCKALREMGGRYVLPFRFRNDKGTRTSHHLIFVSKHPLGYGIMKEIMAKESSSSDQGVARFEYNPADKNEQPFLFELNRPLDDLQEMLLEEFAECSLTMLDVFNRHNIDTPYIKRNYKEVLTQMEMEGIITGDPPHNQRKKRQGVPTCADTVEFTFPSQEE